MRGVGSFAVLFFDHEVFETLSVVDPKLSLSLSMPHTSLRNDSSGAKLFRWSNVVVAIAANPMWAFAGK